MDVDWEHHESACSRLIKNIEELRIWCDQHNDGKRFKTKVQEIHDDALKVRSAFPVISAYVEELLSNTKFLEDSLSKKELRIEKLEFNTRALSAQIQQMREERTVREHGALRRQIAINIEYEIKCEFLSALGKSRRQSAVKRADLHELRDQVLDGNQDVPALSKWLQWKDERTWEQLSSAMHYLKAFSYEAHPTTLEGKAVNKDTAMKLVEESFDTSFVRKMEYPWNEELRKLARHCIEALQEQYRNEGEPLLYN